MQNQRSVPTLRLVCRQWREEIDQFYEFSLNIYDTTTNLGLIKNLRCRECTIWKLTQKLDTPSLFEHPAYLKVVKIYGPTSAENLQNLISASTNLEHLTLTRRANYPWFLNLQDTPSLTNLNELRYLRLNSEEHISFTIQPNNGNLEDSLRKPPMMDCYFPKLKHFEILKRFAIWQYSHYVTCILQFVARHAATLSSIELDLIPLSCVAILDDQEDFSDESSSEDEEILGGVFGLGDQPPPLPVARRRSPRPSRRKTQKIVSICPNAINLDDLCKLRLSKFCVTTKGSDQDIFIWKSILAKQNQLRELRMDWLCRDPRAEIRARVTGFPWIHFQIPVERCQDTLVHVELASLSMFSKDISQQSNVNRNSNFRVIPFDLGIFRNCKRLKSLILKCRENHAKLRPNEWAELNPDGGEEVGAAAIAGNPGSAEEVLLMRNGGDLPDCLEQLEIFRFPMLTTEIEMMVEKVVNIRKLFLHDCGKTGEFGVSATVIRKMADRTNLKFLEVIGFNDALPDRKKELEKVFQAVGLPYEGQDTWLEFSDGSSSAHESLKVLL